MTPSGVMRPMRLPVNHKLPSGPTVIRFGWLPALGNTKRVIAPTGVRRPI